MNKLLTLTTILTLASCTNYNKPEALNLNLSGFTKHTKERAGKNLLEKLIEKVRLTFTMQLGA